MFSLRTLRTVSACAALLVLSAGAFALQARRRLETRGTP